MSASGVVYAQARLRNPEYWSGTCLDWTPIENVTLNPGRAAKNTQAVTTLTNIVHGKGFLPIIRSLTAVAVCLGLFAAAGCSSGEAPRARERSRDGVLDFQGSPFLGRWIPKTSSGSESFAALTVRESARGLELQVEGRCVPQPCIWDPLPVELYGESVRSTEARHALAHERSHFARVVLSLAVLDTELKVEVFTEFLDDSERANYRTEDFYVRDTAASADDTSAE